MDTLFKVWFILVIAQHELQKRGRLWHLFLTVSALISEAKHCNNTKLLEPVYNQRQLSRFGLMCNFGQVVDFTYNRPILSCLILSYCLWRKFFAESSSSYFCCNSRSWWENYDLVSVFDAPTLNLSVKQRSLTNWV